MKNSILLLLASAILFSCKKENLTDVREVIKIEGSDIIAYKSKPVNNVSEIELKLNSKSIFIKEKLVQKYSFLKNFQEASYYDESGNLYFTINLENATVNFIRHIPFEKLQPQRRDAIIIPVIPETTYGKCMLRMLQLCNSSLLCASLFSLAPTSYSLGWSLRCLFK